MASTTAEKPGLRRISRSANRTSWSAVSSQRQPASIAICLFGLRDPAQRDQRLPPRFVRRSCPARRLSSMCICRWASSSSPSSRSRRPRSTDRPPRRSHAAQRPHDGSSPARKRPRIADVRCQSRVSRSTALAAGAREPVVLRLAVVVRHAPLGRDDPLLFELEQRRIERAVVDGEQLPAGLLDAPRNAVAVQRPHRLRVFNTIRASVPCLTSDRSAMQLLLGSNSYAVTVRIGMQMTRSRSTTSKRGEREHLFVSLPANWPGC